MSPLTLACAIPLDAAASVFSEENIHVEAHHSNVGYELVQSLPWRTSRIGRGEFRSPAPTLGRDNAKVFGEVLGMSESEIRALQDERVIY